MAISIIGSGSGANITNTNITLTFSPTPSQNDITVIYGGFGAGTVPYGPSTAGYTLIASNSANNPAVGVWYKVQGASPDANVVGKASGNAANGTVYGYYILRGVRTFSPTGSKATVGPTTIVANAPSITTTTGSSYVIGHSGAAVNDTSRGVTTNYKTITGNTANDTGTDFSAEACWSASVNSGTTADPPAWSTWTSAAHYGITVEWIPEEVVAALSAAKLLIITGGDDE